MDYNRIADKIKEHEGWYATTYTQKEGTKIITEEVTHIKVCNIITYDEFDIKLHRDGWSVTCESANMNMICELRDMLDEIGVLEC